MNDINRRVNDERCILVLFGGLLITSHFLKTHSSIISIIKSSSFVILDNTNPIDSKRDESNRYSDSELAQDGEGSALVVPIVYDGLIQSGIGIELFVPHGREVGSILEVFFGPLFPLVGDVGIPHDLPEKRDIHVPLASPQGVRFLLVLVLGGWWSSLIHRGSDDNKGVVDVLLDGGGGRIGLVGRSSGSSRVGRDPGG